MLDLAVTYESDSRNFYLLSLADTVSRAVMTNKVNWAVSIGVFLATLN